MGALTGVLTSAVNKVKGMSDSPATAAAQPQPTAQPQPAAPTTQDLLQQSIAASQRDMQGGAAYDPMAGNRYNNALTRFFPTGY